MSKAQIPRACALTVPVLVVDDDEPDRRIAALRLRGTGCACHLADTHEAALRLLREHPDIRVAVIDYHMKESEDVAVLVKGIRSTRPDVTLVGHSSMCRCDAFAALGVERFLLKPWTPDDLFHLLSDHERH